VFLAHGTRDTLFPIDQTSRRIASELGQLLPGRPVKYVQFSGGHEVDPSVQQQALEWFLAPSAP
jgi:predicted esterase